MPKVVTHTHLSYPFGHLATASWIGIRQGDVHYNISQPGWAKFAWSSFFAPWCVGATVFAFHQTTRFNAADHLAMITKNKVTTFCAPPTALRMLRSAQSTRGRHDIALRTLGSGGESLGAETLEWGREAHQTCSLSRGRGRGLGRGLGRGPTSRA